MHLVLALAVVVASLAACDQDAASGDPRPTGRYVTAAQAAEIAFDDNRRMVQGGDRAFVREVLSDVQVDLATGTGAGVCNELTDRGQRELATMRVGGGRTCADVVTAISRRGGDRAKISAVWEIEFDGPRASALIKDPGPEPAYRVRFEKDGEVWKMVSLADVEPTVLERR